MVGPPYVRVALVDDGVEVHAWHHGGRREGHACDRVLTRGVAWCGVVAWRGMAWPPGMAWCGMGMAWRRSEARRGAARRGMAWYGMVRVLCQSTWR